MRYHHLNPNYIHNRLKDLGHHYELRVLLVQVDVVRSACLFVLIVYLSDCLICRKSTLFTIIFQTLVSSVLFAPMQCNYTLKSNCKCSISAFRIINLNTFKCYKITLGFKSILFGQTTDQPDLLLLPLHFVDKEDDI